MPQALHPQPPGERGASFETRFSLLLVCFFLSGFAALIYQTAWTRQFALVFGTSELAVATVLAAYMAGLALGATLIGRVSGRIRRPVLVYALLELGIALGALAVAPALDLATRLHTSTLGGLSQLPSTGGLTHALFYLVCSFAILLVPTALMGATLPLLARHAVRSEAEIGPRVGGLYATNTFGAVCGTLVTGFWLLPALGLGSTIHVAIAANGVVFLAAVLLDRAAGGPSPVAVDSARRPPLRNRWILPFALLSGAVSFTYEVVWTRLLGHFLGGSVYAFATMLASFLIGIALGSALAARRATDPVRSARGFAGAQIGVAGFSLAAFLGMSFLPELSERLAARGLQGLWVEASLAALVLLPSTLCIGATFPFAVRVLAGDETAAATASARVFAWNTTGAVLGAIGAGFFIIPALGFAITMSVAAATGLALAGATALATVPRRRALVAVAAVGLAGLVVFRPAEPWRLLRSSPLPPRQVQQGETAFYSVGRSATVLLLEQLRGWYLRTNGLPEALIVRPGARIDHKEVNRWLGGLGSVLRPQSRSILVIGLGGGTVVEAIPPSLSEIDVVELEPEVVRANREVSSRRQQDPLADPRVRIVENDARGALMLANRRYSLIVSQPSHPWTAGASHLYTREFFELALDHLEPEGLFIQWMGAAFVDPSLVATIVATLGDVFPEVAMFRPSPPGLLFVGSRSPLSLPAPGEASSKDAWRSLGLEATEDLAAALALDDDAARAFAAGAELCTDDRNRIAMRSPGVVRSALSIPQRIDAIDAALQLYDPWQQPTPELDRVLLVRRLLAGRFPKRAAAVAEWSQDPAEAALASAFVVRARGDVAGALKTLAPAFRSETHADRAWRTQQLLQRVPGSDGSVLPDDAPARASDRAVLESWRHEKRQDWAAVRASETALAELGPHDVLYNEALRLRAMWRMAIGDATERRALIDLSDRLLAATGFGLELLLFRAQAAAAAGDDRGALMALAEMADALRPRSAAHRNLATGAVALLRQLPENSATTSLRAGVTQHLVRIARGPRRSAAPPG
ncbi:fused MFS/spermidine synthase [Myxococcota bacterium]|nr:fused MFS/spermidine synthase [Myxococcota bacterium]MCZ7617916.1 fused MFS/spermidine synthase [Myxococcota bacterium]